MALIFFYLIGVLISVFPIYYLLRTNMELWNCNSIVEAKDNTIICAWIWFLAFPIILVRIVFHKIDILIRRAV